MRQLTGFECNGHWCAATLDDAPGEAGLLIVSGGNEIRSGAHSGQARLAAHIADLGIPVFRYDRRGIGDSEGENCGFEGSSDDVVAAAAAFRAAAPHVTRIVAFGNCDGATALALFHAKAAIDSLVLANPWVIEATPGDDAPVQPSPSAVRARYLARLKNPRSLIDLFTGKINLFKLANGLKTAAAKEEPTGLAERVAIALGNSVVPLVVLIAMHDNTARTFMAAWKDPLFARIASRTKVRVERYFTASHGFADTVSQKWLWLQIELAIRG